VTDNSSLVMTVLSPSETASLEALAMTPAAHIPPEHRTVLMRLGMIVDVLGAIRLTSIGAERAKDGLAQKRLHQALAGLT
jgi:hypothetical protein